MKKIFPFLLVLFAFKVLADGDVAATGDPVDAAAFFQGIKGTYKIELYAGVKPQNPESGNVAVEDDQYMMQMPYCVPNGGPCYLGYVTLPKAGTTVSLTTSGATQTYAILSSDGTTKTKYDWVVSPGKILFRNYQFVIDTGTITLEYVLTKTSY